VAAEGPSIDPAMVVVSLSLRDGFFVLLCVAILLLEWNLGSNVSLQEQGGFLMYIAAWAGLFTLFSLVPYDERLFDGDAAFSFKCAALSCMQQIIMIVIGVLIALNLQREKEEIPFAEWLNAASSPNMSLERHVHFVCIAAMIKDFWLPDDLASTFILHHLAGTAGCGMCLVLPAGFGAATLNACQAESTSILYNFMFVLPVAVGGGGKVLRKSLQMCYMVGMLASHAIGVAVGLSFALYLVVPSASPSVPWWTWWRIMYVVLSVLILTFRVIGQIIYTPKILFSDWNPVLLPHAESKDKKQE